MRTSTRSLAPKDPTGANIALVSPAPIKRIWDRERRGIEQVRGWEINVGGVQLEGYPPYKMNPLHAA